MAWQGEDGGVRIGVNVFQAELLIETAHGTIRRVVVLAKMAKHDALDARMVDVGNKSRRLLVAQMSERPGDTLFKDIGVRAVFQHFHVVVRLDDNIVSPSDLLLHHLVQHPNIGGNG